MLLLYEVHMFKGTRRSGFAHLFCGGLVCIGPKNLNKCVYTKYLFALYNRGVFNVQKQGYGFITSIKDCIFNQDRYPKSEVTHKSRKK